MARPPNELPSRELRISTTPQVIDLLKQLVAQGLSGKNTAEAADRLLSEKLRQLIAEGSLKVG
jgi:hypothetical protein